jgi:cell division protein FtsB
MEDDNKLKVDGDGSLYQNEHNFEQHNNLTELATKNSKSVERGSNSIISLLLVGMFLLFIVAIMSLAIKNRNDYKNSLKTIEQLEQEIKSLKTKK